MSETPLNGLAPPWAQTAQGIGAEAAHFLTHAAVQHPNPLHGPSPTVSPFIESAHGINGLRGRARHWPQFSAPGLARGGRK